MLVPSSTYTAFDGVAVMSCIATYTIVVGAPNTKVAAVPPVELFTVINAPAVPFTLNVVTVVVVDEGRTSVRALVASLKLIAANVGAPEIVSCPVDPATV